MQKPLSEQVHTIMRHSLFKEDELIGDGAPAGAVLVDGLVSKYGFHPDRLESHREDVREILKQMPDQFMKNGGGGWSFLNLCNTKDGVQWGEHRDMESLCCLAIGLGMGEWQMKSMAATMPGGMPFISFNTAEEKEHGDLHQPA